MITILRALFGRVDQILDSLPPMSEDWLRSMRVKHHDSLH